MSSSRTKETTPGTLDDDAGGQPSDAVLAGLVLVLTPPGNGRTSAMPAFRPVSVLRDEIVIGRGRTADLSLEDDRLSREHARVRFDGARWHVTDHGSRNGTFVDGVRVDGTRVIEAPRTLRLGHSVFLFERDLGILIGASLETRNGVVIGPRLHRVWSSVQLAARAGDTVAIIGESGAGKEIAARVFHDAGPRASGPFVAVNCAAIPAGLSERLLFGARRGAYSGADAHADGYVQAADGGTLFLDEIAELDPTIQAKILRVVETREVLALGATHPRTVTFGLVCATHRSLREAVANQRFREDLFYRIARPEVGVPPLRERCEDIPWLLQAAAHSVRADIGLRATFVEECLLRPWPGNVRELLAEARRATHAAIADGADAVEDRHLDAQAGRPVGAPTPSAPADVPLDVRSEVTPDADPPDGPSGARGGRAFPTDEVIKSALDAASGNVSAAARRLGLHRTQLRRWIASRGSGGDDGERGNE